MRRHANSDRGWFAYVLAPIVIAAGLAMTGTTTHAHDAGALAQEQAERAHPSRAN